MIIYEGDFINNKRTGRGSCYDIKISKDISKYKGYWLNDKFNGRGFLYYNLNDFYNGEFCNSLKNGFGILCYLIEKHYIKEHLKII